MDWTFLTLHIIVFSFNFPVFVQIANVVSNYKLKKKHFAKETSNAYHVYDSLADTI